MYNELELYEFLMYKKGYTYEEAHNTQWKYELDLELLKEEKKAIIEWRAYRNSGIVT